MFLIYIDESGDDGFPGSSEIFVNTAVMIQSQRWNSIDFSINEIRNILSIRTKLKNHMEFHANNILLRKNPFFSLSMTDDEIKDIFLIFATEISKLPILCTTSVVDKTKLNPKKSIDVFGFGVNHLVNRINTTISVKHKKLSYSEKNYMLFCDQGRIQNWERLIASMRNSNQLFDPMTHRKVNIKLKKLIEKPIQRNSHKSHLLQVADFIATIFYKYYQLQILNTTFRSRQSYIDLEFINNLLIILKPIINLDASKSNPYGLVIFPK